MPPRRPPATSPPAPWERQPGETTTAYTAFVVYRDLGPGRSIAKAGRSLGKSTATLEPWSTRYRWVERAAAWEAELVRVRDEATLGELEKRGRRQAEVAQLALEALVAAPRALLERLHAEPKLIEQLDAKDLLTLAIASARAMPRPVTVERLARGMSTSNDAIHAEGPLADALAKVAAMSEAELDATLAEVDDLAPVRAARAARRAAGG